MGWFSWLAQLLARVQPLVFASAIAVQIVLMPAVWLVNGFKGAEASLRFWRALRRRSSAVASSRERGRVGWGDDHRPTDEQASAVEAFLSGAQLALEAGAGTGKTTVLRMMAEAAPNRSGIYLAYNTAVAADARSRFPSRVRCTTTHAVAYEAFGHQFADRLHAPRMPNARVAELLGITKSFENGRMVTPSRLALVALRTVRQFCYSDAEEISVDHVPVFKWALNQRAFAQKVVPLARRVWEDALQPAGKLPYLHDYYLKAWALTEPRLDYDYILLDEGQDANPAVAEVFKAQPAQQVIVGDQCQAINGWRMARDAIRDFPADVRLSITQSFRFGQAVADEANKWLTILGSDMRLVGNGRRSVVGHCDAPDAVLCRTNAEAIDQLFKAHETGTPVGIVGGPGELKALATAALALAERQPVVHPELTMFESWDAVRSYAEETGDELRPLVRAIDDHGAAEIIKACDATVDESEAELVISTVHRAKGREWNRVRIPCDFTEPQQWQTGWREDGMVAYVAVTRARKVLDRAGLTWIDDVLADGARWPEPQRRHYLSKDRRFAIFTEEPEHQVLRPLHWSPGFVWYDGCGWNFRSPAQTARLLDRLVRAGYVHRHGNGTYVLNHQTAVKPQVALIPHPGSKKVQIIDRETEQQLAVVPYRSAYAQAERAERELAVARGEIAP